MSDWSIISGGIEHTPSTSKFWFYTYTDRNNVDGPKGMKLDPSWAKYFTSKEDILRAATNLWRTHIGVA